MLSNIVRILDLDNSLLAQKALLERFDPLIVDLKNFGPHIRQWMNAAYAETIKSFLDQKFKNSITFLGSGDFHHLSSLLIGQFDEPLSVVVFDYHPDWDILPPKFGCGSWVSRILEIPNIKKVILLGVSSDDISKWGLQTANLASLKDNRLEIYPYAHGPSRVFLRKVPQNASVTLRKKGFYTDIFWQELKHNGLDRFFSLISRRVPTKKIYISIDKDCLSADYALTNWEEGKMRLDELLLILRLFRDNFDLAGLDITGDYSRPVIEGKIKGFFCSLDHPREYPAKDKPQGLVDSLNEATNLKILELLLKSG